MFARIFPAQFDNTLHGHWLSVWVLVAVALLRFAQGFVSIVDTYGVATGADGIPVDSYGPAAAAEILRIIALLGMYAIVAPLLSLLAAFRYRAMVPLMFILLIALALGARGLNALNPAIRDVAVGPPIGFYVNLAILALMVVGLVLSLIPTGRRADGASHKA